MSLRTSILGTDGTVGGPSGAPLSLSVVNESTAEGERQVPVSQGGKYAWMYGVADGGDYALDLAQVVTAFRPSRIGVWVQAIGTTMTGNTTNGSKLVEEVTNAQVLFRKGQEVTGANVPAGTVIAGFTSSTTVELSQAATVTQSAASLVAVKNYFLIVGLGSNRYWQVNLRNWRESPGGYGLNQIRDVAVSLPLLSHNVVNPSTGITVSGSWTVITGQPTPALGGPYNTAYSYNSTAGAYIEYKTPVVCTAVGVRTVTSINGGLARVSIDGSTTAATLLPTAEQLVNEGTYPNTILEAHGGTLKPTDRVLDCNTADPETSFDRRVVLADKLPSEVHKVKIEATGYASSNEDQTGSRTYLTGFGYGPTETAITESTVDLYVSDWISEPRIGSAWEYAIHLLPEGAAEARWSGNVHGYEIQDSLVLNIDGTVTHPTAGTVLASQATGIELTRKSHIVSPELGSTVVAECQTVYKLGRSGLTVTPTITWKTPTVIDTAYSMCPVNNSTNSYGAFNRGAVVGTPNELEFPGTSNGYKGFSKSGAGWLWGSTGRVAQLAYLHNAEDFAVNWTHTTVYTRIQERNTELPLVTKIYFPWVTPDAAPINAVNGTVKTWATTYTGTFASGGINTAMQAL